MKPARLTHDTLAMRSGRSTGRNKVRRASDGRHARRPFFESLEDRTLLSSGSILEVAATVKEPPVPGPLPLAVPLSRGTASPVGLIPAQIQTAYGFNTITFEGGIQGDGTGQTIAIIDPFSDSAFVPSGSPGFEASDLGQFDKQFGVPDPSAEAPFTIAAPDGVPQQAPLPNLQGYSWAAETALDVEWAHALAPGAAILLVETPGGNASQIDQGLIDGVNYARQQPGVSVISMSWSLGKMVSDSTFTTPTGHQGITFVAGSGDNGSPATYPATSPNVLSVGGTFFPAALDAAGDYSGESAWDASGGGVDTSEAESTAQVQAIGAMGGRAVPDVAFDAGSSVAVYDSYDYGATPWTSLVGTSLGAPAWSALVAIADQGRAILGQTTTLDGITQTIPELYSVYNQPTAYQPAFHDIISGGNNGDKAGTGYDLVTGLGTPNAPGIASLLSGDVDSPTLIAPVNNAVVTTTTPAFQWSPVVGSVGYDLTVTDTTTGKQVISYSTPASGNESAATSYTPPSPLPAGDAFSWSVNAVTSGEGVSEGQPQSFVVLPVPVPVGPTGVIDSTQPTLQWLPVIGVAGYEVSLTDVTTGESVVSGEDVSPSPASFTPSSPLNNLDTYQWTVSALGNFQHGGLPFLGPESGSVYFTVNVDAPPVAIAPANQDYLTTIPQFQWSPVAGAVSYDLTIVNENVNPTTQSSVNVSGTSYTPSTLPSYGYYQWFVQASFNVDGSLTLGASSQASYFYYESQDNAEPQLVSPLPGSTVSTDTPTLKWSFAGDNIGGTLLLNLYLYDVTADMAIISQLNVPSTTSSYTLAFPLDNGHTYLWSILAGVGPSAQFTVSVPGGGSEDLLAPTPIAPQGVISSSSATFQWSAVPGATEYEVHLNDQTAPYLVNGTSLTLSPDDGYFYPGEAYSWTVTAYDASGDYSFASQGVDFGDNVPGSSDLAPPTNLSPAGVVTSYTPTFSWSAIPGAIFYSLDIYDETTGTLFDSETVPVSAGTAPSVKIGPTSYPGYTPPLLDGHRYQWYVTDFAEHGSGALASQEFIVDGPSIASPSLIYPITAGGANSTTPAFQWSAVPGAAFYVLTVLDLEPSAVPPAYYYPISGTSFTPTSFPLLNGHTYQWFVSAVVTSDSAEVDGPPSPIADFAVSIPGIAVLDSPVSGATLTTATPTLAWSPVQGADGYNLYLRDSSDGTEVLDGLPVAATSYSVTAPLRSGDSYQWYVTAYDNYGDTGVAPAALAFTVNLPPVAVPLPNPLPIGHSVGATPTLQWTTVPMATSYDLYITDTTTQQQVQPWPVSVKLASGSVSNNIFSYTLQSGLLSAVSDTYEFYVRAVFADESLGQPGPTEKFTVSTSPDLASPPELESPTMSTPLTQPSFQWLAVTDADSYEIEIDDITNNTITNVLEPTPVTTGTSYTLSQGQSLTAGRTYQWQVEAVDNSGQPSAWSMATFQILLVSPPNPTAPKGTTISATPNFNWSQVIVTGTVTYQIQVIDTTGGAFSVVATANNITALQYELSTPLALGHTYEWQVAANYGDGQQTAWSSPLNFQYLLAGPTLGLPSGVMTTNTPLFSWSQVTGASGYQIQITDTTTSTMLPAVDVTDRLSYMISSSAALTPGQSYQWQVAATVGSNVVGQWSAPTTFSISATPPQAMSIVNVAHAGGKVSGFTIVFNESLEVASADSVRFYQVKPGTRKGTRVVYGNPVTIKTPIYNAGSTKVMIRLAKPATGPIELIVLSGIIGADGVPSTQSKPFPNIR
jgi:hypothetical protein